MIATKLITRCRQAMTDGTNWIRGLLADQTLWLDSTAAGLRIDSSSSDPKAIASQLRKVEKLFAAWDGQRFHYPAFQFLGNGGLHPKIAELIKVLPRDTNRAVGLDAVMWVFAPDHAFKRQSPAKMFADNPEFVIEEARIRLEGGRD